MHTVAYERVKWDRSIRKASGEAASCMKARLERSHGTMATFCLYSFTVSVLFAFLHRQCTVNFRLLVPLQKNENPNWPIKCKLRIPKRHQVRRIRLISFVFLFFLRQDKPPEINCTNIHGIQCDCNAIHWYTWTVLIFIKQWDSNDSNWVQLKITIFNVVETSPLHMSVWVGLSWSYQTRDKLN